MRHRFRLIAALSLTLISSAAYSQKTGRNGSKTSSIYHQGWIDFNKNGVKDTYEDPSRSIDDRVEDLLMQMTLDEKTCQLVVCNI